MMFNPERTQPDAAGFFGRFGGGFISETLAQAKALAPFVTTGWSYAEITPALLHTRVEAGADVIELSGTLAAQRRQHGLDLIFLLASTSFEARIQQVSECASSYVYGVAIKSVI